MRKSFVLILAAALVAMIALSGVAYAVVTVHGTQGHDWGDKAGDPPGCSKNPCGHMIGGTLGADKIYGYDGWDWVDTKDGNDVVFGGRGMDKIYGRSGSDEIHGQSGHDHLFGDSGDDKLLLHDGQDEPGHVEQANGTDGHDYCVMDEDTREAIIVTSCEILVIKDVKDMEGATKVARGVPAWESRKFLPREFYPGTYRF